MISFPNQVFREGGPHWHPVARTRYSIKGVYNEEELQAALADGWRLSMLEPVIDEDPVVESEEPLDDSPPTKEEMLQKAEELGLKIDKRWSEKTLLAKIEEALQ